LGGGNSLPASETVVGEAANNDGIANIILSLRTISEQNWSDFFEAVSCLEQTLREDPAGIYPRMDFKTRNLYRKEIEALSFATGQDENELGRMILNLARQAPVKDSGAHVGEYLLGKGRAALEQQIGYQPDIQTALKRWLFLHASAFYFFGLLLLTLAMFTILGFAARLPEILGLIPQSFGISLWGAAGIAGGTSVQWGIVLLLGLALLIPALTIATSLVNWLITLLVQPRILPKLDFKSEIPDSFQTLVVIPAMITNRDEIDSLVQQLELHYLRNPEPGLFFALLTDFRDADTESLPEDAGLVAYAIAAIEALNVKYENSSADYAAGGALDERQVEGTRQPDAKRFYFLHRKRLWNPSEGKWIGWERKRGKLHELNQLLRGGTGLSFTTLTDDMSAASGALQQSRFVITLDTDTVLPRGAACRLAGTLAHPLNWAIFDETTGQVVSGYTILQPRMEIHPRSANLSLSLIHISEPTRPY
jgi:hypothetical protein